MPSSAWSRHPGRTRPYSSTPRMPSCYRSVWLDSPCGCSSQARFQSPESLLQRFISSATRTWMIEAKWQFSRIIRPVCHQLTHTCLSLISEESVLSALLVGFITNSRMKMQNAPCSSKPAQDFYFWHDCVGNLTLKHFACTENIFWNLSLQVSHSRLLSLYSRWFFFVWISAQRKCSCYLRQQFEIKSLRWMTLKSWFLLVQYGEVLHRRAIQSNESSEGWKT